MSPTRRRLPRLASTSNGCLPPSDRAHRPRAAPRSSPVARRDVGVESTSSAWFAQPRWLRSCLYDRAMPMRLPSLGFWMTVGWSAKVGAHHANAISGRHPPGSHAGGDGHLESEEHGRHRGFGHNLHARRLGLDRPGQGRASDADSRSKHSLRSARSRTAWPRAARSRTVASRAARCRTARFRTRAARVLARRSSVTAPPAPRALTAMEITELAAALVFCKAKHEQHCWAGGRTARQRARGCLGGVRSIAGRGRTESWHLARLLVRRSG